jgi:hypothetical protein
MPLAGSKCKGLSEVLFFEVRMVRETVPDDRDRSSQDL